LKHSRSDPTPASAAYVVYVDDNFHYQDESYRTLDSAHDDRAAAIQRCKIIVDDCLRGLYTEGMSADELLRVYQGFGEDPWIATSDAACRFSAWTYAAQRCQQMCAPR
jgi:hypothetical protein